MNKMSLPKGFKSNLWIKNWSGNWRTPFASLYRVYTCGLQGYVGTNLKTNLIVCEQEVSTNYIAQKELDRYCTYLADLVISDPSLAKKWAVDTVNTAEDLLALMASLKFKKNLNGENLSKLKLKFYEHVPPHFSMKKVVDYLPLKLQKTLMPRMTKARTKTENLFNTVDATLNSFTQLIAQTLKIPPPLADFLTIEEIQNYFNTGEIPTTKELVTRSKGMGIYFRGDSSQILKGPQYRELQKIFFSKATELKGTIAYQGVARGRARIVFDPAKVQANKFKVGDILITGMTRPEFLPLMKKAGAFVTDAGGLLSHAAIVARELKKPCLLATQTATKVFKDGDLVEVDASQGVVRKIIG